MQIQKLKLATFAIGKRLQGFHLLKNPKTASPLELTMLKSERLVHLNGDIVTWHERISKDFEKNTRLIKETLITKNYYSNSAESKKEPFKRYVNLTNCVLKSKGALRYSGKDLPWDMYQKVCEKAYESYYRSGIESSLMSWFCADDKPIRPNFFKVLLSNLSAN